jgi:uncharacterized protein (DUF2249 family)
MSAEPVRIDVRTIPPRERHPTIFAAYDRLRPGDALVIVNDHDPRPLRYQLMMERSDAFEWIYEAEGPEVWQVRDERQ